MTPILSIFTLLALNVTVLDPGHFHAALVLKHDLEDVSKEVKVYAPEGKELDSFLSTVESFNGREDEPTTWKLDVYRGKDYLSRLPKAEGKCALVLAGDNRNKSRYILEGVRKGYNILSDKPMAINSAGYRLLKRAYRIAARKGLVILELMTERYDTLNILARETIASGRIGRPVSAELTSIHHFSKIVAGKSTTRPEWYYDVKRQGEGIADVTTHLVDILFWQCFQDEEVTPADVRLTAASHYPTTITPEQYAISTGGSIDKPIDVYSNGSFSFLMKDMEATVNVRWDFVAPEGCGDTYQAVIRGTEGSLVFVQDEITGYVREMYIDKGDGAGEWLETGPRTGHEEHFGLVARTFIDYVYGRAQMPSWEYANTLAKYSLTTKAVKMANK